MAATSPSSWLLPTKIVTRLVAAARDRGNQSALLVAPSQDRGNSRCCDPRSRKENPRFCLRDLRQPCRILAWIP